MPSSSVCVSQVVSVRPENSGVTFGGSFDVDKFKVRTWGTDGTASHCERDATVDTDSSSLSMNIASSDWNDTSTDALDDCCGENKVGEFMDIDIDLEQKTGSGDIWSYECDFRTICGGDMQGSIAL